MTRIRGIFPALLTPFDKDGNVDTQALAAHCDFLIEAGVHGLYIMGTTGEVFLLSKEERKSVAEFVISHVGGRVPVFVQVGSIPTDEACELAAHAEASGAAGVGAITPHFFYVDQEAMKEYYRTIAASVRKDYPVYLYNLPARTGNDLLPETVRDLAEVENIVGIKNSMADLERLNDLIQMTPAEFEVVQGADTVLFPGLLCGAVGTVSGNANVFPELMVDLYNAVQERDYARASACHRLLRSISLALRNGMDLAYFKQALEYRGLKKTHTRRPLPDVPEQDRAQLQRQMKGFVEELTSIQNRRQVG